MVLLEVLEVRLELLLLLLGSSLGLGGGDLLGLGILLLLLLLLLLLILVVVFLTKLLLGCSLLHLLGLSGSSLLIDDKHGLEEDLVVLSPLLEGQLSDDEGSVISTLDLSLDSKATLTLASLRDDVSCVTIVGRNHALDGFVVDHPADVGNNVAGGEVGCVGGPPGSDSVAAVDKHERDDGHVEGGLDGEAVVVEVSEEFIIVGVEDGTGDLRWASKAVVRC